MNKEPKTIHRCLWPSNDELMIRYHDEEWGVPVHNDRKLFEYLVLDAFQAGLSWKTILYRREGFRKAFDNFNPEKIAKYNENDFLRLMNDASIIRNKAKINGTIKNAKAFIKVVDEFGSFDKYIWQFTGNKTIHNKWKHNNEVPAFSPESDAMSKDMKKRGFSFCGTTICYAFMQAAGMINDHSVDCFRYQQLLKV